jgi:hypothetical protein
VHDTHTDASVSVTFSSLVSGRVLVMGAKGGSADQIEKAASKPDALSTTQPLTRILVSLVVVHCL